MAGGQVVGDGKLVVAAVRYPIVRICVADIEQVEDVESYPEVTDAARIVVPAAVDEAAGHADVYAAVGRGAEHGCFASAVWRTEGKASGKGAFQAHLPF